MCTSVFRLQRIDGIDIDQCPKCRGGWLDSGEFDAARMRLRKMTAPSAVPSTSDGFAVEGAVDVVEFIVHLLADS